MKKIIAIITLGASVAFLQVQAQDAPQSERTQNPSDVTETTQEASVAQKKVEIDQSELPQPVMDSFKKSEYRSMDIVNVYEVNDAQENGANSYQSMSNRDAANNSSTTSEETADKPQESTAQANRALDSAVYQSDEKVGASQQEDQPTTEVREKVDQEHQEAVGEVKTPEETEETGQVMTADAPAASRDKQMTDAEIEEKGKELYEGNKYDNFTEATNDAYAEVAKEEVENSKKGKKYELQVKGDNEAMTLTYDENGELVKADKGAM